MSFKTPKLMDIKILFLSVILILSFIPSLGLCQSSCNNLPKHYNNYNEAIKMIKNAKFNVIDNVNTDRSSFIRGASYYSCDNNYGFLIVGIGNRQYLYDGVPRSVWQQFKQSNSFGSFYDRYIRGRYRFNL